jgi:hypothetical protein
MAAQDEYILQESFDLGENEAQFDIVNKKVLQVNDSNLGNYSSQEVIFDLSTIANSGAFLDWKTSYLQLPVVLQVTRGTDNDAADSAYDGFCASIKNGNFNMVHAMTLQLSNQQVINLQGNMNGRISYELVSSMSSDDAARAIQYGYQFEDGECHQYSASANANGIGNSVVSVASQSDSFGYTQCKTREH